MTSGGAGAWRSRGRREAMPKPVSQTSPVGDVDQDVGRLDVLVDKAAPVQLSERGRQRDGEAEKSRQLQRLAQHPLEGLAAGVLQHQHPTAVVADECQRARRPGWIELLRESELMLELSKSRGGLLRGDRGQQQKRHGVAGLPAPVKGKDTAFPQSLEEISGEFRHAPPPHRWRCRRSAYVLLPRR